MEALIMQYYLQKKKWYRRQEKITLLRHRRFLRDISNPFEISDGNFEKLFRMPKCLAEQFINLLDQPLNAIPLKDERTTTIPVHLQVLTTLRYLGSGSHQVTVGQDNLLAVSQATCHRILRNVITAMNKYLLGEFVVFPTNDAELARIKQAFFQQFNIPGVIGAIDCTHVSILSPPKDVEHVYLNRKGYHSKNVQLICNLELRVLNVNARFGGSTHDAFIWKRSQVRRFLKQRYDNGNRNTYLLGDGGYPTEPWLLVPFARTVRQPEIDFNTAHCKARNPVERCNGCLKSRFRCISRDSLLRYDKEFCGQIINCCVIIHNFLVSCKYPVEEILDENLNNEGNDVIQGADHDDDNDRMLDIGRRERQNIVDNYFQ